MRRVKRFYREHGQNQDCNTANESLQPLYFILKTKGKFRGGDRHSSPVLKILCGLSEEVQLPFSENGTRQITSITSSTLLQVFENPVN